MVVKSGEYMIYLKLIGCIINSANEFWVLWKYVCKTPKTFISQRYFICRQIGGFIFLILVCCIHIKMFPFIWLYWEHVNSYGIYRPCFMQFKSAITIFKQCTCMSFIIFMAGCLSVCLWFIKTIVDLWRWLFTFCFYMCSCKPLVYNLFLIL